MDELLSTKLFIPRPRANLVLRPRLTERLNAGLDKKLTLIAAPAGFGKTTLLSEWIPRSPRCVTWLSLDEGDNDPTRFWVYLISSLQQLRSDIGESALALLQSPQAPPIPSVLTALINDISAFPDVFATVLDDYHVLDYQPIHDALTFLIAHLPANMHLVITTRVDPPLPLARLRAHDQLAELRANDLRFTVDESAAFLNQVMGLRLSTEEVATLEARTEGWIAGLQIASLSMRGHDDISGFIQAFSGSYRHILGYLAEEVLDQLPKGRLSFLMQTSILDRLCGSLCNAVTGDSSGREILEELEQANLFIIPLDDEGVWYRYHHLFAEVLQARLRQSQPELLVELHMRASEWYQVHRLLAEAVEHALAAGNTSKAAALIEQERWNFLGRGEANTLHRWLDELPDEIVGDHPGLSLAYAWIFSLLEQVEAIEPRLQAAERALSVRATEASDQSAQGNDALRGEIATLRAETALSLSDIPRAIELCQHALKLLPENNPMMRGVATYFLGHGERRSGHMADAERIYSRASALGLQTDNLLLALHALANLSAAQITRGHLREAAETSQRILQVTDERRRQAWPVAGLAYQGLSKLHYEWNDLDAAIQDARMGIECGQRGGLTGLEINSLNVLAFTLQAQHDPSGADQVMQQIATLTEQKHHPVYSAQAATWEARLRLRQADLDAADAWAETCGLSSLDIDIPYAREMEYLTLARVFIARGRSSEVSELLARLKQTAESDQRTGSLIQVLMLQALACRMGADLPDALGTLERALLLAEPEGYVRTFVDEGEPMRRLLSEFQMALAKRGESDSHLMAYTDRLLSAFAGKVLIPIQSAHIEEPSPNGKLVDPLSERELEILRLISQGLSNQEIAVILVVAVSTVKSHINHLYGKLGTHSRTRAVALARERGLVPD